MCMAMIGAPEITIYISQLSLNIATCH